LGNAVFAELRLDLIDLNPTEIKKLTGTGLAWIVAVREGFLRKPEYEKMFQAALHKTIRYVDFDIPLLCDERVMKLVQLAQNEGIKIMLSSHNFTETPSVDILKNTCREMLTAGADALKIVCKANKEEDVSSVRSLYSDFHDLTAFCLGEIGRETRIEAMNKGLRITYVHPDNGKSNASGQYSFSEMCTFAESGWKKGQFDE